MSELWDRKYLPVLGYGILVMGVVLAFVMQDVERRNRVATLNQINTSQCQEIESLKNQFREDAHQDYGRLAETLRLLNVKETPELRLRAKMDRDQVLSRFKQGTCPRKRIK